MTVIHCRLRMLAAWLALMLCSMPLAAKPVRVMSLNLCTDILLLHLADRNHIVSLSFIATDSPLSPIVQQAAGIPPNHATAEEVLAFQPDLVVARRYTATATVRLARRLGFPVLELDDPHSIAETETQILTVADALQERARGEGIVAGMQARLSALPAATIRSRPVALVYGPNGYAFGAGSLLDDLLRHAGFDNLAARAGLGEAGTLPLETVLLARPDVLVFERESSRATSLAEQLMNHPALRQLTAATTHGNLSSRQWNCGGPEVIDAVERLAALRQRHELRQP